MIASPIRDRVFTAMSKLVIAAKLIRQLRPGRNGLLRNLLIPCKVSDKATPYHGKSTIEQIFTLRQILEKTHEKQVDTYHLFVDDYKAAP